MSDSITFVCLGDWDSTLCLRARNFGQRMEAEGWDVYYIIPDNSNNRLVQTTNVHLAPTSPLSFLYRGTRLLRQIDSNYVHFLNPNLKALCLSIFIPSRSVVGDWEDWHAVSRDRGFKRLTTRFADYAMRRRADYVIVCSQWLATKFSPICRVPPVYIPYAALPVSMPNSPYSYQTPTVVWMGSFRSNMDYDLVLEAVLELKARGVTPNVEMIGSGPDWKYAVEFKRKHSLENLSLPGFLDQTEMLERLCGAHVLVFPIRDTVSNRSRCPFKVFQYAQAKRPVITNRVGEVESFLGDEASYIPCTSEAFANEIASKMEEPRIAAVDYGIDSETWDDRTARLIAALDAGT